MANSVVSRYPGNRMDSDMHVAGQLTALGWTMLALYVISALLAFRAASKCRSAGSVAMGRVWICLGVALGILGLNKQLDLQTLLIKMGRNLAIREHLFPHRMQLYAGFFLAFMLAMIGVIVATTFRFSAQMKMFARQYPFAACGCALICAYIVLRAAFIDNVNLMLNLAIKEIPFVWLLEAGGILLIAAQALRCPVIR
ncbi:MAG: hypothetical protein ACREE6_08545 [Limisphaerales bacterium]